MTDFIKKQIKYEDSNEETTIIAPELFIKKNDKNQSFKSLIEVKDIFKNFGKNDVLKGLNFSIYEGEHLCLIGSNGAGKTVTVEMIAGLIHPNKGEILYHFETTDLNKQIGIQFQAIDFPAHLTPIDVINFNIDLYKLNIEQNEVEELIENFKIKKFINRKCSKLSGGQKQRLNVLLSLLNKPKIVFLDEFSTGLDFLIKSQIEEFISSYAKKNNITIVVVSHDVDEISFFAKRILGIHQGKVVLDASKEEVIEKFGSIRNMMKEYIK